MLVKRNMDEMITHFNDVVSAMDISSKDKMTILGMITAIGYEYQKAADAIEELSQIAEHYKGCSDDWYREACDYKAMLPCWIPVTERLPEEYKDVLCYYEYFRYGDYNCMFRTIDRGYYGNGIWGGEAGQGHKNKVIAWMPLPQPPKEET